MKKFWIIFGALVVSAFAYWSYGLFIDDSGEEEKIHKVTRQDLTEVISEVGTVVPIKEIDLTFPMTGTVAKILITEGENVTKGALLAQLDTAKIYADINNAQATVQEAQANLDKLIAGATTEDIQVYETGVTNAEIYLDKQKLAAESNIVAAEAIVEAKKTDLTNAITRNDENIKQAYEDAVDAINDSVTRIEGSIGIFDYIQTEYFGGSTSDDRPITNKETQINNSYTNLKPFIEAISINDYTTIDQALTETLIFLNDLSDALTFLRQELDSKPLATLTDKGYVDTERTSISTAIISITSTKQAISSATLDTNIYDIQGNISGAQVAITQAEANLASVDAEWNARISQAEGELQLARDQLLQARAPAREEDISLYKAQLNQAIAYADLMQQTLNDTKLITPLNGIITTIYTEIGELATINTPAMSMITVEQYKIEAFISELDVAQISLQDKVEVTFDAFDFDEIFEGEIININPYETIDDGDIFYEITIELDEENESIRSGMTVNITIKTADKEDVLVVPSRYIGEERGQKYVKLLVDNGEEGEAFVKVEVTTGLKGKEMTEIVEGLEEGQEIIPYY